MKRNIVKVAVVVISTFFIVIAYLTYLQVYKADYLLNHPRNKRLQILGEVVTRGRILDDTGRVLAETVKANGEEKRLYPYGEVTGNLTGYLSKRYGLWGLEMSHNKALLGLEGAFTGDDFWAIKKLSRSPRGNDIVLSIDAELQKKAYNMLGDRKGAIVAIEPSTGRVLAMASKPSYSPENIGDRWESLISDPDSPLLNRASQGLYPAGSIMKVVTAAGILKKIPETINRTFDAPGYIIIEGKRIEDKQAQGKINFFQAFEKSSNFVFATIGLELGAQAFLQTVSDFGVNKRIPFDVRSEPGRIPAPETMSKLELGETAIGQGRILVTPLHMALVASAVANKGQIMAPTLVDSIVTYDGDVRKTFQPRILWEPVQRAVTDQLRELMVSAVAKGTGKPASAPGLQVAGKTGTAQNPHGQPHAWFIGFAPADNPLVAVAVIVENAGAGSQEAAPIAREIIKLAIEHKR